MCTTLHYTPNYLKFASAVTKVNIMSHRNSHKRNDSDRSTFRSHQRQQGYTAGKSIPDRWLEYSNSGIVLAGTRLVAFKTPLKDEILRSIHNKYRWSIDDLIYRIPDLGLVIDLTFTKKYYNIENLTTNGIKYQKIYCKGHEIPNASVCQQFRDTIQSFCNNPANDGKLIGVHCTHGLNRTGYLVCHFMITVLKWPPKRAISEFERTRGHRMERNNYIRSLLDLENQKRQ